MTTSSSPAPAATSAGSLCMPSSTRHHASDVVATARDTDARRRPRGARRRGPPSPTTTTRPPSRRRSPASIASCSSPPAPSANASPSTPTSSRRPAGRLELLGYTSVTRADTSGWSSPRNTGRPRSCSPRPGCRSCCCATRGTSRTTPVRSPPRSSTASSWCRRRGPGQRRDARRLRRAAAAALVVEDQAGRVYELGGDTAFTLAEYAATLSAESGTKVTYRDLSAAELPRLWWVPGCPSRTPRSWPTPTWASLVASCWPTPATLPGSSVGPRRRRVKRSAPHWPELTVRPRRRLIVARLRDPFVALLASASLPRPVVPSGERPVPGHMAGLRMVRATMRLTRSWRSPSTG